MPKKLHEIKGFNAGIITSPDQTDLPEDATPYSLDVSADNGDGMLVGRYADKNLQADGWNDNITSVGEVTSITCVASVESSLNSKYFSISTPSQVYKIYYDFNHTGSAPDLLENEEAVRIGVASGDGNLGDSSVALATMTVMNYINGGEDFTVTRNGAILEVTCDIKGIVLQPPTVADSGFTISVTTDGVNHNISSKSMAFISKGTQKDLLYVDSNSNRLNRISDFEGSNDKVLGSKIHTDKIDFAKRGRSAVIGRGKNQSSLYAGYLDSVAFSDANEGYFLGDNELKPPDKAQPLAQFTKMIKISQEDNAIYACTKGQPFIWRIDYNTNASTNLGKAYICAKLPFNVDLICECVSVGGTNSYIWAYSGPGNPLDSDYNSFESSDYQDGSINTGKLYKLKVNDSSSPIDWALTPSLSILKTIDKFDWETYKGMNWTHDTNEGEWNGFAKFGDILETGNSTKSILWFLITPSFPEEAQKTHWFRTTSMSEEKADDAANSEHPSWVDDNAVGSYRTHRWLYASKNMQDVDESGGTDTLTLYDKTPQHMGTLTLSDSYGFESQNGYDWESYLYSWRFKIDAVESPTNTGTLFCSRFDESAQSDEYVSFAANNLDDGGNSGTDGTGVYTIAKNVGMFTNAVFGNYTGDNCGTKYRSLRTERASAAESGGGPGVRNNSINICPLEYSLVDLTDEYGIDCDTNAEGNAVVGCMAKIGSSYNGNMISGSDGVWMINKIDAVTNVEGDKFHSLIADTVDSNNYTYSGGSPSDEYRVNLENKVVMYITSFVGNDGALGFYDTENWTTGKSLGSDSDYTTTSHNFSSLQSSSPDNRVRQIRWFDDTTSSLKAMDFNGAQMPKQTNLQGLNENTTVNSGKSTLFYSFNNYIGHDDGDGVVPYFNSLFAIDIRQVNGASNTDPDLNRDDEMGYFNDTSFQINFDGDGKSNGDADVDNQHPRMQDSIMLLEEYNDSGLPNQSTDVDMNTTPTARLIMFDRDGGMGLINIDINTELSTINNISPIDGETNSGSENFTLNHFGRALTPHKYKFGTNDSFLSLITPNDPGSGTIFKCKQDYYYKISFLYDGFQESPLTMGNWKFNANEYDSVNYSVDDGSDDYSYISLKLKVSNISSRITHINLYRTDSPTKLYRLVKSVRLDSTWSSIVTAGISVYEKTIIDEGVSGATYEAINNMSETIRNTTINYKISTVLDGCLFVGNCGQRNITDASAYIFKSNPGNFSQFDWSVNYLKLPTIPVAMKAFRGRVYAWDESNMYVINSNLILEDTYEGIGCLSQDSVFASDVGMCFADKFNIYLQTTEYPTIISAPISVDRNFGIGYQDLLDEDTFKPIVTYNAKINSFMIFMTANKAYVYNLIKNRWDLWSFSNGLSAVVSPKNEVLLSTSSKLINIGKDETARSQFTWYSKKLSLGRDTQDKFFKKIRLTGASLANTEMTSVTSSKGDVSKSLTSETDNNMYNLTGSNRKAKWIQMVFSGVTSIIHSIGILYRDRSPR